MNKFLNQTGLSYFWGKIKTVLESKVDKENEKGLSTFDYDGTQKQKVNKATIDLNSMKGADFAEAGKALKAKVVEDGKVTAWEFGDIDTTDKTLSVEGKPADAKAVGDALVDKVDVISGKSLSTNDYTTAEKDKLAGIATQATRVLIDNTLSQNGQAADAKITGDTFTDLKRKTSLDTITDIASGPIAHFEDGADSIPMKDVLVHVDPVQDLHGYDSPWPAGGGKNLLNPKNYNIFPKIMNGITFTQDDDGGIRANGTATAQARFYFYYSSRESFDADVILSCKGGTSNYKLYADNVGSVGDNDNKILSANTTIGNLFLYVESGATVNTVVYPMIRLATESDSTFAPYSNICPITGWTGCVISHSGADTTNPTTYSITFPTEAGTVYGGTLDVTKGELVVDRAIITMDGSQQIVESQAKRFYTTIPSAFTVDVSNQITYKGVISDKFRSFSWGGLGDASIGCAPVYENGISFKHPDMNTVGDWKTYFTNNPTVFSYELATPITYQLTPQEITSLLGENNVWADTGDSEVEYVVETTGSYVDKISGKISELETIAQDNLVAGINAANIYEPTLSSGAINAMLSIAEEYFNYAYTGDHISGLVYSDARGGEEIQSSAFTPVVEPLQTVDGIDQYTINCSNFANLMLQAISLKNSRYISGTNGTNIHYDWNYPFDETVITKYVGNVNSDKLYKYAKEHGFGYKISEDHSNVKAGDFIFAVDETSSQYLHIAHVAFVLQVGDNRIIIIEGTNTTRISREGNEYNVGLKLTSLNNFQAYKYGARFPIHAESNKPNLIEYNNRQQVGTAINSKNIISVKNIKQGFYTIIVDGEFAQPNIKAALRDSDIIRADVIKTFVKQGNKYILTYYVDEDSDEMLIYAEGAGKYTINTVAVYKGYASIGDFIDNFYDYRVTHILENGTDLNTVLMEGWYSAPLNSNAETILNCPILTGFVMRVVKRGSNYNQIIYYANGLCLRHSTSTGWGSWYKIIGTEVS